MLIPPLHTKNGKYVTFIKTKRSSRPHNSQWLSPSLSLRFGLLTLSLHFNCTVIFLVFHWCEKCMRATKGRTTILLFAYAQVPFILTTLDFFVGSRSGLERPEARNCALLYACPCTVLTFDDLAACVI